MVLEVQETPLPAHDSNRKPPPSRTVASFAWLVTETIVARAITFLSQLVLAYLLVREDFGLFVMTNLVRAVADLIATPGFRILLIQRHLDYQRLATPVFWLSATLGLICSALIIGVTLFTSAVESPTVATMILIVALSVPFRAISVLPEAALRIRMQFGAIAFLGAMAAVITAIISIGLAYLGFGAISLVAPFPIVALFQLGVAWWLARPKVTFIFDLEGYLQVIRSITVLFSSRVLTVFSANVDYFFLLMFHSKEVVGVYFLAFNISTQTIRLFSDTLVQVLMPTLAHILDPEKQCQMTVRATRAISLIVIPCCFLLAVVARQLVELCFRPEYATMVPILQLLCIGMAFRCVGAVSNALLNAQGRFGTVLWFDTITTLFFGVSAGLAAWWGTAVHMAAVVGINVIVRMIFLQQASLRQSKVSYVAAFRAYLLPAAVALAAGLITELMAQYLTFGVTLGALGLLILKVCAFVTIYIILALVTMNDDVKATCARLSSLWHRIIFGPPRTVSR